jgi:hypothetical protein
MATWNKIIFSGSDAQVSSMDISTPSANPTNSLVIEDGQVDFGSLPGMSDTGTLEPGRVMVGDVGDIYGGTGLNLWVKNDPSVFTGEALIIPQNGLLADLNNDGQVSVVDLLTLLTQYGTVSGGEFVAGDITNDGAITVADLLVLLGSFGVATEFDYGSTEDDDTRPFIDWGLAQYNYIEVVDGEDDITHSWVDNGLVTKESVTTLYDTIKQVEGENYFWNTFLPHGPTVSTNVSDYMTQMDGLDGPNFEVFIYIYFTQTNTFDDEILIDMDGDGIAEMEDIGGGSDIFNRAGVAGLSYWDSLGQPLSPLGYEVSG